MLLLLACPHVVKFPTAFYGTGEKIIAVNYAEVFSHSGHHFAGATTALRNFTAISCEINLVVTITESHNGIITIYHIITL